MLFVITVAGNMGLQMAEKISNASIYIYDFAQFQNPTPSLSICPVGMPVDIQSA